MGRGRTRWLVVLGIVLASGSHLAAQTTSQAIESIRGVALVVGNANYANVPALSNPVNDATDMATALKDLGWDVILVKDAKLTGMKQAVRDFSAKLAGKKAGLFYYAGHGIQVDGTNYLVPTDADIGTKAEIPDVTYSADTVLRTMDDSRVPVKIVILDACRDNPFAKSRSATGGTRGLAPIPSTGGTVVVYATSPGDVSQDGSGRNGVFTEALLKNLKTPGVEFGEIFDQTAQAVSLKTGGQQKPRLDKGYYGKLYLISPDDAQKQAEARLAALKAEQDKLTADMAARDTAIAGAKTQAEKDKLQLTQQKALALAAAQKQEQADLERAKAQAENRAAEEAKNKAAATARANDAEVQLVALRQQAEAQKQKASAASANADDPAAVIIRVADLDASLTDIGAQFAASLDRRVAEATKAADARAALIDKYEEEFWENDREFADRKNQAKALATRDRDNEIAGLKASFAQATAVQTGPLQKQRDDLAKSLTTRDWPIAAANLSVARSDFDKENKSWDFTITCTAPAFSQKLTYKLVYSTADELKTLAVSADNAWKAGAFAAQAVYSVRPSVTVPGYFEATISRLDLVDVTKTGKDKKPLVVVSAPAGVPLGWVGKAPAPAKVTITVPRSASIWAAGTKLADLKAGAKFGWSTTAFGPAQLEARYTEGDTETLSVKVAPGLAITASFLQRVIALIPMVNVQGGTFLMGGLMSDDEAPRHNVTLSSFSIGTTEVTQAQYQKVMGSNPSSFRGDNRPVEQVSWFDAVAFCNKLSEREKKSPVYTINWTTVTLNPGANGYRLPTEAEWEFAAKGGAQSEGYLYAGSNSIDTVAWHNHNSTGQTQPVGTMAANELGLYDMSGNVWEWVWDRYENYSSISQENPVGTSVGPHRVKRGGSWNDAAASERSARRDDSSPDYRDFDLGFRIVSPTF